MTTSRKNGKNRRVGLFCEQATTFELLSESSDINSPEAHLSWMVLRDAQELRRPFRVTKSVATGVSNTVNGSLDWIHARFRDIKRSPLVSQVQNPSPGSHLE
jgi:hypothetical protein